MRKIRRPSPEYTYRVFVTNMKRAVDLLMWFYYQRAGAENLIREANNDAGLAAYPSGRWLMNCNHFQLVMLAYNLNCWLMLFHREEEAQVATLKHTKLATAGINAFVAVTEMRAGSTHFYSSADELAGGSDFVHVSTRTTRHGSPFDFTVLNRVVLFTSIAVDLACDALG
jgi:Transposase DDE domain group 1